MEPQEGGAATRDDAASERDASAKRAQSAPPPLLALWSRADVADAVVDFLPSKTIARLSVVAKPLRDAQARVVHAAARRRRVAEAVSRATFQALEAGEPFREDWKNGSARWSFGTRVGYHVAIAGTPPQLELGRFVDAGWASPLGLSCKFSDVGRRVVRFRVQVSIDTSSFFARREGAASAGCVAITGPHVDQLVHPSHNGFNTLGNGIFFQKDDNRNVVSLLCFKAFDPDIFYLVESVTDKMYTVDMRFSYDGYAPAPNVCDAHVSVNGARPVVIERMYMSPVNFIHLYSREYNVVARYGDIDVWYEPPALEFPDPDLPHSWDR